MQPRPGRRPLTLALALLTLLAGAQALTSAEAQTTGMTVALADPALGGASGNQARLDVEIVTNLTVAEDGQGRHVRLVMPQAHDARIDLSPMQLEFFAPDDNATDGDYRIEKGGANQTHAVFRWARNAPPPGTEVGPVTLEATRDMRLGDLAIVIWPSHQAGNVSVRVDLPDLYDLLANGLTQQAHNVPRGRQVWTGTVDDPSISLTLEPTGDVPGDPFPSYRPNPFAGWLIVIGLGVVSGGAWVLGKKMEPRDADQDDAT